MFPGLVIGETTVTDAELLISIQSVKARKTDNSSSSGQVPSNYIRLLSSFKHNPIDAHLRSLVLPATDDGSAD